MNHLPVTVEISTKNRYDTTLSHTIVAVIQQTKLPEKILIFDDGEHRDLREHPVYKHIFTLLDRKGIKWEVIFGARIGQVQNHQLAIELSQTEWIWRLDDDNIPEPSTLEDLYEFTLLYPKLGAVGGLVLDPRQPDHPQQMISPNRIKDITLGTNCQWHRHFELTQPFQVEHLYSTFLFRKEAASHGYCQKLSPVGHREETIFSYQMHLEGWELYVIPYVTTWHLRQPEGGIRSYQQQQYWENDEAYFQQLLARWNTKPARKLVVLDNGLGDHFTFKMLMPEMKAKYGDDGIILAVCYPEVFNDEGVQMISIAEAKNLVDDIDQLSVYRFMAHNNWKQPMIDAYRRIYQL